jgi:hypothetical protein
MFESAQNPLRLDENLINFIDSLALPKAEAEFIKQQCFDPSVSSKLKGIWHDLEGWGEGIDAHERAVEVVLVLIDTIKGLRQQI